MSKLKIAIQKSGRLSEKSLKLLEECGIKISIGDRKLKAEAKNFPVEILFLRDDDIPQYVEQGVADIGILGENEVWEKDKNVKTIEQLGFAGCKLSLAIPKDEKYTGINYFQHKKIATSYPKILQKFFDEKGIEVTIEEIGGSVEIATGIGLADAIFDIVSSGSTLLMNGLKEVEVVFITLGTAYAYFLKESQIPVANCHKIPNTNFEKKLISISEIVESLENCIKMIQAASKKEVKIIFTVSPIRHTKEGIIENNRSKAILLESIHQVVENQNNAHYFPSYELMMDDLRDYRFYKEDMIHPTKKAQKYIWNYFSETYFLEETIELNKEIASIKNQLLHKPFFPESKETQEQQEKIQVKINHLKEKFPFLTF